MRRRPRPPGARPSGGARTGRGVRHRGQGQPRGSTTTLAAGSPASSSTRVRAPQRSIAMPLDAFVATEILPALSPPLRLALASTAGLEWVSERLLVELAEDPSVAVGTASCPASRRIEARGTAARAVRTPPARDDDGRTGRPHGLHASSLAASRGWRIGRCSGRTDLGRTSRRSRGASRRSRRPGRQ